MTSHLALVSLGALQSAQILDCTGTGDLNHLTISLRVLWVKMTLDH